MNQPASAEVIPSEVFRVLRATDDIGRVRPIEPCRVVILPVVRIERAEPAKRRK